MTQKHISHYELLDKLGEGGMGVVYRARDTRLDRIVALKFISQSPTQDADEKERFEHEARAGSSLNHPNICTIHEIDEHDGRVFIAMECIEGQTLKQRLTSGMPLPLKQVLDTAIQIAEGLSAAHERGMIHRDLKSENIMVTPKGQVKIMDFGLAKLKGATKITKAGTTIGTAAYMSPEQALGEEVDQRSDIFSFGVVLYEMLAGHLPFRGEHQAAVLYAVVNEEPLPLARFVPNISPKLEEIVAKALSKDRNERYQHVDDMAADLRRERKHLESATSGRLHAATAQGGAPQELPPRPTHFGRYVAGGVSLLAIVLAFLLYHPFDFRIVPQKGAASDKASLAVLYFENLADPEDKDHTGDMLTNLLTTSLFQTRGLEVVSRERLYDIERDLGHQETRVIPATMASRVAERAGVSLMLLGSIIERQPTLAVTYRLIDVATGKIVSTRRLADFPPDRVFGLVDTLALLVKDDLNVSTKGETHTQPVAMVTSRSPEAYRSYLEGVELNDKWYTAEARAAFNRAIELDSSFAMAYFGLAMLNGEANPEARRRAITSANACAGRATEYERLSIESEYARVVERNLTKSIALSNELIEKYPHEQFIYLRQTINYSEAGDPENAARIYERGIANDSLDKRLYNQAGYIYGTLDRRREAFAALDRYLAVAPGEPNPYDSKGDLYVLFDQLDSAASWYEKAISFRRSFPSDVKLGSIALIRRDTARAVRLFRQYAAGDDPIRKIQGEYYASLLPPLFYGKFRWAEGRIRALATSSGPQDVVRAENLLELTRLAYMRGDAKAMLDYAMQGLEGGEITAHPVQGGLLAIAYLKTGDKAKYTKAADEFREALPEDSKQYRAAFESLGGFAALEEEDYSRAAEQFDRMSSLMVPRRGPLLEAGIAYVKAGRLSKALHELERLTCWVPIDSRDASLGYLPFLYPWHAAVVLVHYWLGVAYEQQGQRPKALEEYRTFLEIWKDADFPSKELADARLRVTRLSSMASR